MFLQLLIEQALSIVESTRSCLFRLDRPGSPQEQEQQEQQPAAACPFSKADAAAGAEQQQQPQGPPADAGGAAQP